MTIAVCAQNYFYFSFVSFRTNSYPFFPIEIITVWNALTSVVRKVVEFGGGGGPVGGPIGGGGVECGDYKSHCI